MKNPINKLLGSNSSLYKMVTNNRGPYFLLIKALTGGGGT